MRGSFLGDRLLWTATAGSYLKFEKFSLGLGRQFDSRPHAS